MTDNIKWTNQAIECYYNKSCDYCKIADICLSQPRKNIYKLPPIKYLILSLLDQCGIPDRLKDEELI